MSDWAEALERGKLDFQAGRRQEALNNFNLAASLGGDCTVYEYRAALHEKLGNTKQALLDAKKAINLDPRRWQSYARAAGLFLSINKFDAATSMIDHALERVDATDSERKKKLLSLKERAQKSQREARLVKQKDAEKRKAAASKKAYQFGKLPMEIIVSIFEYVVEENHSHVLHIARVCGQWRRIAFSAPSLWGTLVVTDKKPQKKMELWCRQSRGNIEQLDIGDYWKFIPADFSWDRLTSLRVAQESVFAFQNLCLQTAGPPALRSLDITFCDPCISSGTQKCIWYSIFSPTLQHVKLDLITFSWVDISDVLTSLVSLDVTYIIQAELESFIELLRANSSTIQTLAFKAPLAEVDVGDSLPKIILPQLAHLTLHPPQYSEVDPFLMLIDIPHLQSFSMGNLTFAWETIKFLKQSQSSLTTLCLSTVTLTSFALIYLLKEATSLTTLKLTRAVDGNTVVESLADPAYLPRHFSTPAEFPLPAGHETRIVCPQLKHIDLTGCHALKTGPLLRMVKARLPVNEDQGADSADLVKDVASIETLIVDGCEMIEADLLPWFRSKVPTFSCVYMSKKAAKFRR